MMNTGFIPVDIKMDLKVEGNEVFKVVTLYLIFIISMTTGTQWANRQFI